MSLNRSKAAPEILQCTQEVFSKEAAPSKIESIRFDLMSATEIARSAEFHVYERNLYKMPERIPLENGILDPRLGTTDKKGECKTCFGKLADCCGHFGYVKLELPVFHIGYFKNIISILQCVCKSCARCMAAPSEREKHLKYFRNPRFETLQRRALHKKISDTCKRCKVCPYCSAPQGVVKRAGTTLKIVHEKYAKNPDLLDEFKQEFDEAMKHNDQLKQFLPKVQDDLNPIRVLSLFERITAEDCELLDIYGRPEHLILTHLPVPPVCIRPSVDMESTGGSNEDDITMKLMQIIENNNTLRKCLQDGEGVQQTMEVWDGLQVQCATYINSELPGLPIAYQPAKPMRGFVQRLKGKQGRFRGNLSGKRVDFSGRTVISPDPNLRVDEVGVPLHVALIMTYPERVSRHNIEKLRQCVRNGMLVHPGANFVVLQNGTRQFLKYGDRRRLASELKYGDIVERHLENGDIALFNRQPSLHKMSIMAHRVRVMPWRTFRFNECVCAPYNADFDGDEMNLHVPQTEEARAEAIALMGVHANLCTPKNGEILIAATQDFLTASYLLTGKDVFLDRAEFALLCSYMGDAKLRIDLPPPAIIKPVELWTGKQVFSVLVRPNGRLPIFINFEAKERFYSSQRLYMDPSEGWVCFRNSELMSGRLGKGVLGGSGKAGLFYVLQADCGADAAAECMNRLAKLSARYLGSRGFSIGIDDVTPSERLNVTKEEGIHNRYQQCDLHIENFKNGTLQCRPGCNEDQTLEAEVLGELNAIREDAGRVCRQNLPPWNSPLIMSQCGSKGSVLNICQMVACVGQQTVGGARVPNGFFGRSLPHFERDTRTPQARGFCANSFYSGLTPTEFFFHTMGGREGLVDTAVKTAETGYMSRRLMKALEDLSTKYDSSVRNSSGGIVQLVYGDDGLDPVLMEGGDKPVDFKRQLMRARALRPRNLQEDQQVELLHGQAFFDKIDQALERDALQVRAFDGSLKAHGVTEHFRSRLKEFLHSEAEPTREGLHGEGTTQRQLEFFIEECIAKYERKRIEPGSAVGAVGAQSIGEPGTQMTLKTFHFAGVASMNVTLGVPRIKEIINASKNIATPIMQCELLCCNDPKAAHLVKGRLERTTVGEVAKTIRLVLSPEEVYMEIKLDIERISALQLDVRVETVANAIIGWPKLKLKGEHVALAGRTTIRVFSPEDNRQRMYFTLQNILNVIPKVIVQGIPTVERAVVNDKGGGNYSIFVEGTNLQAVMGTEGVKGEATFTNHVLEMEKTLGIEAARWSIIHEINETMSNHGLSIDHRHSMLLADVMTYKGEVLGITRFGMAKMKDSALMLASFEKTTDVLFDAAIHGRVDQIVGVSESVIMGIPMPIGTGLCRIQQTETDADRRMVLPKRPPLLLAEC